MDEKLKKLTDAISGAVQEYVAASVPSDKGKPEQKALPLNTTQEADTGADSKPAESTSPPTSTGKDTAKTEPDKTGNITITADTLTKALSEAIKQNAPDVGAPSTGGSVLTMDAIKQMSEAEINANWEQVSKVLADSKGAQQ